MLAIGSEHSSIDLYSTTTGTLLARLEGHTNRLEQFYSSGEGFGGLGGEDQAMGSRM